MADRAKGPLLLVVFILLGLIGGSLASRLLRSSLPFLRQAVTLGFAPRSLMLGDIFSLTLGFRLRMDVATMGGLVLSIWVYRRM